MSMLDTKPTNDEYAPFFAAYIERTANALDASPDGRLQTLLAGQFAAMQTLVAGVDEQTFHRGYAPGKWTLAESLVHVSDVERVFAYRLLRIARGDATPLPSFDHDAWVPMSGASTRTLADILTELDAVRNATLALVRSIGDQAFAHTGTVSGHPISARAVTWNIAGHFEHHLELTRTRYLGGA
jgi:DinB superfamily